MGGVAESSRLLAALSTGENDSGNILDASRALAAAIAALLGAGRPEGQVGNTLDIMEYDSTPYMALIINGLPINCGHNRVHNSAVGVIYG